jgi:type I restriction enzyme S subunit
MIFEIEDQVQRLKWAFASCKNGDWGAEPDGENDVVCVRAADFDGQLGRLNNGERTLRSVDIETFEKLALRPGDIILEKSGGGEKQLVGRAVIFEGTEPSITSNFLARCRPAPGMEPGFLNYLMLAIYNARGTFPHLKQSTGIQNLDLSSFLTIGVRIPPFEIQQRIARFLDEKTARIDSLVEKKRALLDRLAEKRQALIIRAVTKGLNPAAPMKSTGIDWLGDIPAHWEVGNIRRFAKMKTGHTPSRSHPEYWDDCSIPWFTLADVWQLRDGTLWYLKDTAEKISEVGLANSAAELLPAGTVVFSRTASVGYSGIMPEPMATSQDFWNWICGPKLLPEYLLLLFRSMTQKFEESTSGSTHKTIYQGIAAGMEICVAPINEQHDIATHVFARLTAIDFAAVKVRKSMDSLTNYRVALISSAVTRKLAGLQ